MLLPLFWLVVYLLLPPSAAQVAANAGHTCERGCIVGAVDGWVYEVTRDDLVWVTRMANCEIGDFLDTADAPTTMWAVTTNFYRRHLAGRSESLSAFVSSYSACTSRRWATGGDLYSPRIAKIADVNRRTRWRDLPQRTRDYVHAFFRGEIPNDHPTFCWVWTRGYESHAERHLIGPEYVVPETDHSTNAYWADPATRHWTKETIRIVPATGHNEGG